MNVTTKRTLNSLILFLSSFIYFFLAYAGFKKQNIDLKRLTKRESVIVSKGVGYRHDSKGRDAQCFYIRLKDHDKKLGVYRMSKHYNDLDAKFNLGDTVTVYYRDNSNRSENINIDLIQVEKHGLVLIDKKEYEKKENVLIYIGMIAGVLTIAASYFYYKRKFLRHAN